MLLFCLPGLKKEKSFLTSSFQESLCVRQKIGWFDVRHSICESMVFFFFSILIHGTDAWDLNDQN